MLAIVARSATDIALRPGPKNSTNLPTTPFLRSICVTVSTRSVAVTPSRSSPVSLKPIDLGQQHRERLAEHRRFRLDAADAPAEHGEAVDHRGVAVGADQRVGIGDLDRLAVALLLRRPHGLGEIFEVDLVADAGARRHDGEIGERLLAPLEEAVALLVLLVFALDVLRQRLRRAEIVDHDRMVDDQVDRAPAG